MPIARITHNGKVYQASFPDGLSPEEIKSRFRVKLGISDQQEQVTEPDQPQYEPLDLTSLMSQNVLPVSKQTSIGSETSDVFTDQDIYKKKLEEVLPKKEIPLELLGLAGMAMKKGGRETLTEKNIEYQTTPKINLTEFLEKKIDIPESISNLDIIKGMKGGVKGVADVASALTTPENISLVALGVAAPPAAALMGLGFAPLMIKEGLSSAYEAYKSAKENGISEDTAREVAKSVISIAMGGAAAKGSYSHIKNSKLIPEIKKSGDVNIDVVKEAISEEAPFVTEKGDVLTKTELDRFNIEKENAVKNLQDYFDNLLAKQSKLEEAVAPKYETRGITEDVYKTEKDIAINNLKERLDNLLSRRKTIEEAGHSKYDFKNKGVEDLKGDIDFQLDVANKTLEQLNKDLLIEATSDKKIPGSGEHRGNLVNKIRNRIADLNKQKEELIRKKGDADFISEMKLEETKAPLTKEQIKERKILDREIKLASEKLSSIEKSKYKGLDVIEKKTSNKELNSLLEGNKKEILKIARQIEVIKESKPTKLKLNQPEDFLEYKKSIDPQATKEEIGLLRNSTEESVSKYADEKVNQYEQYIKGRNKFKSRIQAMEGARENTRASIKGELQSQVLDIHDAVGVDGFDRLARAIRGDEAALKSLKVGEIDHFYKLKNVLNSTGEMFKSSGIKVKRVDNTYKDFKIIDSYYPRKLNPADKVKLIEQLNKMTEQQAVDYLINNKAVLDIKSAKRFYKSIVGQQKTSEILRERKIRIKEEKIEELFGIKYKTDLKSFIEYLDDFSNAYTDQVFYGKNNSKLQAQLDSVFEKYGAGSKEYKNAADLVKSITNIDNMPYGWMRRINALAMGLGSTVIQIQQSLDVGSQSLKGFAKSFTKEGTREATRIGTTSRISDKDYHTYASMDKNVDSILDRVSDNYIKIIGQKKTDLLARRSAAFVGKEIAKREFDVLKKDPTNSRALQWFKDYGLGTDVVKALEKGELSQLQIDNFARMFDKDFNFWMLKSDIPKLIRNNPTLFQFWAPAYLQFINLKGNAISNIKTGSIRPLIMLSLAHTLGGELYGDINDIIRFRNPSSKADTGPLNANMNRPTIQDDFGFRMLDNMSMQGGGIGLPANLVQNLKYANSITDLVTNFSITTSNIKNLIALGDAGLNAILKKTIDGKNLTDKEIKRLVRLTTKFPLIPGAIRAPMTGVITSKDDILTFNKINLKNNEKNKKRFYNVGLGWLGEALYETE